MAFPLIPIIIGAGATALASLMKSDESEPTKLKRQGVDVNRYRYRSKYFDGWNSLDEEDKNKLFERYPDLKKLSGDDLDNSFRNKLFTELFENSTNEADQKIWANRQNLTRGERDILYAQKTQETDVDGLSNYAQGLEGTPSVFTSNALQDEDITAIRHQAKNVGFENTARGAGERYLRSKVPAAAEEFRQQLESLSTEEQDKYLNELDNLSSSVSSYYDKYNGTDKLNLSREDKLNLLSNYMANQELGGNTFANRMLGEYYQNTVANNQSFIEKLVNSANQFSNTVVGELIRAAGMVVGITGINQLAGYNTDASYGDNILDNDITRYGDRVATTGSYSPEEQKEMERLGLNVTPILDTADQERAFMSWNTPFKLFGEYGFTTASTILSFGAAAAVRGATKAAIGATKLATAGNKLSTTARGVQTLEGIKRSEDIGNLLVAGAVGSVEGAMNAVQTKDETEKTLMKDISSRAYQNLINDSSLGTTPEEREAKARELSQDENYLNKYYGDEVAQAKEVANTAMYQDFWVNSAINGLIGSTFKATLHAPAVQKSLSKLGLKKSNLNDAFTYSKGADGVWKATAKKVTTKDIITERFKEAVGESLEEYTQDLSSTFAQGYNENKMQQYIDSKYNNKEVGAAIETDMIEAISAGMESVGKAALSKESMQSLVYGGLSTLMGGPNIKPVSRGKRKDGESIFSFISRKSPISVRGAWTPFLNNSEVNARNEERKTQEEHLNEFFSDKEVQNALFNVEGTNNFLKEMQQALQNGDEKTARDARLAAMFGNISTLNGLKGSSYYDAVITSLQKRASFNAENLDNPESAESKAVDLFLEDVHNRDLEYTREEALEQITKSSQEMLSLIDKIDKESTKVDKLFGKGLDSDVKASLVYNRITMQDNKERIQQLDEDLSKVKDAINNDPTFTTSEIDNTEKDLIVRFGSVENAVKKKSAIENSIKKDEKALKNLKESAKKEASLEGKQRLNGLAQFISKRLEAEKKGLEELSSIEESYKDRSIKVLTAADIMNLSASERAYMLNPKNRDKYSAEQQVEIDKLLGIGNSVFTDFSSKVTDRAILEADYATALQSQSDMLSSSSALSKYAYQAKKKLANRAYALKNQHLIELENQNDYEGFAKEFESILNRENADEIQVVRSMLSSSNFYKKYMEEKDKKDSIRSFVNRNNNLEINEEQANVFSVMQDYLSANGVEATSIDEAVAKLTEETADVTTDPTTGQPVLSNRRYKLQDYIDKINESLSDDKKITITDFNSSIQTFKNIMGKYNEHIEEQAKLSKTSNPSQSTTAKSTKPNTTDPLADDSKGDVKDEAEKEKEKKEELEPTDYGDPIINKVAKRNPNNTPIISQAEFIVNNIKNSQKRYGEEATNAALKALEDETNEEFANEEDFETAIHRAENGLIASSEESNSIESRAAAILKTAREEYSVYKEEQIQAVKEEEAKRRDALKNKKPSKSLFQRGSDKYIDFLSDEERARQQSNLAQILNGYGVASTFLSPETNAVILDHLAKTTMINSVNIKSWWGSNRMPEELKQFWITHRIEEYLISKSAQELQSKPVYFISPDIHSTNEQAADYDYTIDSMLVAVVEDSNGKLIIGDKHYQPIALMPRSYDGIHNRYYHRDSVNGTAHLLGIRKNAANTPKGSLITDEKGIPIQTRITSFVTGSRIATNMGYRPASQVNIDNFTGADREEIQGKNKQEIRNTNAYKKAKQKFLNTFVFKGGVSKCFIRLFDNWGRPVGGKDGLVHVNINMTPDTFGKTVARNSDITLEQVVASVLADENNYSALYDSSVPYNEGGFNKRTQAIGRNLQNFFKNIFKLSEIESLPNDSKKAERLKRYGEELQNVFIHKYGVYFDPNKYKFLLIPSNDINGKHGFTLTLHDVETNERFPLGEVTEGNMSDKTTAKIMANLFMNGGQMRHGIRWQISPQELGSFSEKDGKVTPNEIAKEYLEELYDDGIVQTNKTRLSFEVNQVVIQSPFNSEGTLVNPQPIVPTVNNDQPIINSTTPGTVATTGGEEVIPETGTTVEGTEDNKKEREVNQEEQEAKRMCDLAQEDSKDWSLTDDQTGYTHKNNPNVKYTRVTSAIAADESNELDENGKPKRFDPNSEWATPSSLIGNSVDEFIRNFFDGKIPDDFDFTTLPNASAQEWKTLHTQLKAFRDGFVKSKGLTIIPKDVIAHGSLEVTNDNGRKGDLNVAGTLDLLAYDSNGNLYIFDMKTYRSSLNDNMPKYTRQVSVYKKLLEQRFAEQGLNVTINSLSILPINVSYPDARSYDYQQENNESNQLLIRGKGEENFHRFKGTKFTLGMPIEVQYKEPKLIFERLTEEQQSLVKWKDEDPSLPNPEATEKEKKEALKEPKETTSETPAPTPARRAVRGRGNRRLNIGGVLDEKKNSSISMQGDPKKSLSWLRTNDPKGYKVAEKYNQDKQDNTAWDNLPDSVKDSYLSCINND